MRFFFRFFFPFVQASGSLYGALGGSILAYRIADFLGALKSYTNFKSPYHACLIRG
jgi:hypothetical protein